MMSMQADDYDSGIINTKRFMVPPPPQQVASAVATLLRKAIG